MPSYITYRLGATGRATNTVDAEKASGLSNQDIDNNFHTIKTNKLENNGWVGGDTLYSNSSGNLVALAKGTDGQILKLSGGLPVWAAETGTVVSLQDDTATTLLYPTMSTATTGTYTSARVSSTALNFDASTGTLNSTTFNSLSDARFKKDLLQISDALNKVKQLSGYTFTLLENDERSTGLLAQDVKRVLPEAIGGNDKKMTVSYGNMMGLIVEAIKELDDKLEEIRNTLSNK